MESPNRHPPQQVVVADDFSPSSRAALDRAAEIACRAPWHVLHFVTAIDPIAGIPFIPHQRIDAAYAEVVHDALGERVRESFAGREASAEVHVFLHARIGKPAEEILGVASDVGADLVIVGSHARSGLTRVVLGSVSEQVVREALCPVMVARAKTYRDVELARVIHFDGPIGAYQRPHRYGYVGPELLHRPADWPLL